MNTVMELPNPLNIGLDCPTCYDTRAEVVISHAKTLIRIPCHVCNITWRVLINAEEKEATWSDELGVCQDIDQPYEELPNGDLL